MDNKYKMYYCSGKLIHGRGAVNPQIKSTRNKVDKKAQM